MGFIREGVFFCVHVVVYVSSRESVEGSTPIVGCWQPDHSTLGLCCNPRSVGDPHLLLSLQLSPSSLPLQSRDNPISYLAGVL